MYTDTEIIVLAEPPAHMNSNPMAEVESLMTTSDPNQTAAPYLEALWLIAAKCDASYASSSYRPYRIASRCALFTSSGTIDEFLTGQVGAHQ